MFYLWVVGIAFAIAAAIWAQSEGDHSRAIYYSSWVIVFCVLTVFYGRQILTRGDEGKADLAVGRTPLRRLVIVIWRAFWGLLVSFVGITTAWQLVTGAPPYVFLWGLWILIFSVTPLLFTSLCLDELSKIRYPIWLGNWLNKMSCRLVTIHKAAEPNNTINRRVWGPWSTAGFGIVVGIVLLVITTVVAVAFVIARIASGSTLSPLQLANTLINDGLFVTLATFATTIVCVGLIAIIIKVRRSATIAEYLGFQRISRRTVVFLLAISTGFVILSDCLSLILGEPLNPEWMVNVYKTSVWPPLLWVAFVIFAPAFEETFFRGFLFRGFIQSRIGVKGTIILTALIWALIHTQYDVYVIAAIFVSGIVLGIVRFKTGSLWSSLLMHALWNLIATLQLAFNINSLVS
ncbi:lysostaphin resistance A-like protein [Chloroflexota bacterium]